MIMDKLKKLAERPALFDLEDVERLSSLLYRRRGTTKKQLKKQVKRLNLEVEKLELEQRIAQLKQQVEPTPFGFRKEEVKRD